MTKEDIKKALEICTDDSYSCDDCPYDDVINCGNTLKNDVYELIVEQEKEIERLKAEFKQLETNAEILARGVRDLNHENYELTEKVKQAKIDVLNKVKERAVGLAAIETYHICNLIDELIKEVENDK